jgi:serine/threonine protein phosphatase 1
VKGIKAGRRLVVSDVHGYIQTLKQFIAEKIRLRKEDQLFLLGDYIDRGPASKAVLDYLIDLQQHYQVVALRGNHEAMLLEAWEKRLPIQSSDLLNQQGLVPYRYITFISSLPYYYELEDYYLVHAGFNFHSPDPFSDYESMLWTRQMSSNPTGKSIIHGHQVVRLCEIKQRIEQQSKIIPLDNGCYYGPAVRSIKVAISEVDVGYLCCLDLDNKKLILQENID